jgi:hypothetical protein
VRSVLPWIVAAFVLYLAAFIITVRIHVSLNDDIKAAGPRPTGSPIWRACASTSSTSGSAGTSSAP